MKSTRGKSVPQPEREAARDTDADLQHRIAVRAYELFLRRGAAHGGHVEDWLQAEREILAEHDVKRAE